MSRRPISKHDTQENAYETTVTKVEGLNGVTGITNRDKPAEEKGRIILQEGIAKGCEFGVTILVCGRTGVGKSSLINEIFGANVCPTGGADSVSDNAFDHVTQEVKPAYKKINAIVVYH